MSQNVNFYLELIMFQIMLTIVRNFYHFRFKPFLTQLMQFIIFQLPVVIIKGGQAKYVGLVLKLNGTLYDLSVRKAYC